MHGKVIGSSIAVDCFEEVQKDGIYFLSEARLEGPLPSHVDRIYTSTHNALLLRTRFHIDPDKLVALPINEKLLIQDKIKELDFTVILIDAKQKPGAVMFLFEGDDIGNILYAGRCCYDDDLISRPLCNFLKVKMVDYLYIHDACEDCHNHSMSKSAAVEEVVNIVRWNPNCKVVISDPCFREDILIELKDSLTKPICVSEDIMKHLEEFGRGSDFILDKTQSQVYITAELHEKIKSLNEQPVMKIVLIPCTMKRTSQEIQVKLYKLEKKGYNVILYRNHCSPLELVSLVRDINARHSVLLWPNQRESCLTGRKKGLNFWSHLGDFSKFIDFFDDLKKRSKRTEQLMEVCPEELQNESTDCHSETTVPPSCIVIDSDVESIASEDTVLHTPAT